MHYFAAQQHAFGACLMWQPRQPRPEGAVAATAAAATASGGDGGSPSAVADADVVQPLQQQPAPSSSCYTTAALGPFPAPCNLAVASPDGRWVAVVGDTRSVFLVDQQQQQSGTAAAAAAAFSWRALEFGAGDPRFALPPGQAAEAGEVQAGGDRCAALWGGWANGARGVGMMRGGRQMGCQGTAD